MSATTRMATMSDEQLLDLIGAPGTEARNAAEALRLRALREGADNAREAVERSGTFRALDDSGAALR